MQQREQIVEQGWVIGLNACKTHLGNHGGRSVRVAALGKRHQHCGCQLHCFFSVLGEQRQQRLGQTRQVPLRHYWLVSIRVAPAVIDRTEHCGRVVAIDECAWPVIDRLARDGHVVGVHHTVHEAHRHPASQQRRLRLNHLGVERKVRIRCVGGVWVMTSNGVSGEALKKLGIARGRGVLKGADAKVACGHTRKHCARQRSVSHYLLACGHNSERSSCGDTQRMHRLADHVLAQHRPNSSLAVAAASEWRAARTFEMQIANTTIWCGEFAQQQRASVAESRRVVTELMAGIRLRNRARTGRQPLTNQCCDAVG